MKFSEMRYERPDIEAVKAEMSALTEKLASAADYGEAREAFLRMEDYSKHLDTMMTLSSIRHSIDTRDEFYDKEEKFWNEAAPELEEYDQIWTKTLLESRFRPEFAGEFGDLFLLNYEIASRTFSADIIPDLQRENELIMKYDNLTASAAVPFEGGTYTLSQMTPFKKDPDDARRLIAWTASGSWCAGHQEELDSIYDELTHIRDSMGRKLGYDGYTQLGYYRMGRNCYTMEDIAGFREEVLKYVVPVADGIYRKQAERTGCPYPLSYSDEALMFRSGNPKPVGTPEDILEQGRKFYNELSPETGEFFNMMLDDGLMDVLSTEGKSGGGYCTTIIDYGVPFIFANFNGTQGDVEVVTHEAGHAFAAYVNRDRIPYENIWPGMESCEVHSMSMEFLAWPWAEEFFGPDKAKFLYSHLAGAVTFIPYGTMVDHFQHLIYEKPKMTPQQRHETWRDLMEKYMPWMRVDGEIPFYGDGHAWQMQRHIYENPFYYIDYCLAQTVALEIWAMALTDRDRAWKCYMDYTLQGGSRTFTGLLENAGLKSPFEPGCLQEVCLAAQRWLESFDLSGIR